MKNKRHLKREAKRLKKNALKEKRRNKRKKLAIFASKLNSDLPKSEIWFQEKFKCYKIHTDQYNQPFMGFIPDVINKMFKYIIEIDGSVHDLDRIKRKDEYKTWLFQRNGYKVFRIKAYDNIEFKNVIDILWKIRKMNPINVITRNGKFISQKSS